MRIFKTHAEALNEIQRDLGERGTRVRLETYQDKNIAEDPDFETMELLNYDYTVLAPLDYTGLHPTQPWADVEFEERISGEPLNPGHAWEYRPEVWEQFLEADRRFSYTYPERMARQVGYVITELRTHPHSRQLFISIWDPTVDPYRFGRRRVPCSLGYQLVLREDRLNLVYLQRSADFVTHFSNDVYLACRLLDHIAEAAGLAAGHFTHKITSLHVYRRDVADVF